MVSLGLLGKRKAKVEPAKRQNRASSRQPRPSAAKQKEQPPRCKFSSMMTTCAQDGQLDEAEVWLERAHRDGAKVELSSYATLVNAYAQEGNVQKVESLLAAMTKYGLTPTES